MLHISTTLRRKGLLAIAFWIGATGALGGCSWLHFGTNDDETYDYRKSKPRQEPLEVPPDLSQLPKDDRFQLPGAPAAKPGTPAATPAPAAGSAAGAAAPTAGGAVTPAGMLVAPANPNAHIVRDGSARWLAADVSPELAYATIKDLWVSQGYKIVRDEPLIGLLETDWAERHPQIDEDMLRNGLHKALGAFDSNGERDRFRARIDRTASNTTEVTITHRAMVEIVTGVYKDSSKWQRAPSEPELEVEMLQRLALRLAPAQPLRVAVTGGAAAAPVAAVPAPQAPADAPAPASRVHKVASGGTMTLQVEDSLDRTWRLVGVALDRGGFTVEERRRDRNAYLVRYLDPDYEAAEREKRGWWDRIFNADAKVPEQQFLIAVSANGTMTGVEVQDKDGRPDGGATARRILDQLQEQLQK